PADPTSAPARFYVTTPIYYVNDRPHIGHVYTTTLADVAARYHRLLGVETFFLTGVDEHAAKVAEAAAALGLTPQQCADRFAAAFEETFTRLKMTHNDFIRTSQERHKARVGKYVAALLRSGDVYLGEYEGWYDAGQEEYVTESKAKEHDFKSPINGKPLVRKSEKNYFFRLSAYQKPLLDFYAKHPKFVRPEARLNEVVARVREGLNDVPMSRTGSAGWGIPMPGDEAHTIYVWIDALFNYLTTVDTAGAGQESDGPTPEGTENRRKLWPTDVHLIAKDILWFHAVIWPAVLMALAKCPGYAWVQLPGGVYAHSFWIAEGQKMSKSLGNFVDIDKLDGYVSRFGLDALRYFLATAGPLGTTDSDFAEARFIDVYNADLANALGNSFSRVSNMTARYFDGKVPEKGPHVPASDTHTLTAEHAVARAMAAYESLDFAAAAAAGMDLVRAVDSYIEQTQPFKLAKDPANLPQVGTILYHCAEALRIASLILWPIIPHKVEELWSRLGCTGYAPALADRGRGAFLTWAKWGQLKPGAPVTKGDPLFPRYQA
ncbi:MAG: methionine--tRNA ligase, partial [Phycisphaeraceae bacterium]|nr:methionine--tRNA ligase [Phycisphaeraceae bacterium]